MTEMYYAKPDLCKKYLSSWVRDHKKYKKKGKIKYIFYAISVLIIIRYLLTGFTSYEEEGIPFILLCALLGVLIGMWPFLIGYAIDERIRKKIAHRYIGGEKEAIQLFDDHIEYSFNMAGEPEVARHIYYMYTEDFKCARYDSKHHMLVFIGKAKLENYDDFANKKMNKELPISEMPEGSAYGIFMGYTNEEELVNRIKSMATNIKDAECNFDFE
jgi:hypothetical protein